MDDFVTLLRAQWDRVLAFALLALGAVMLIVGSITVSGASNVADQLSFLASSGLGGLFCLGLGASLLVSANLQDEWRKLDELVTGLRDASAAQPTPAATTTIDLEDDAVLHFTAN